MQICKIFTYEFIDIYKKIVDNPIDLYALRLTCKKSLAIVPNIAESDIEYLVKYLQSGVLDYRLPYIWNVFRNYGISTHPRANVYKHICRGPIDTLHASLRITDSVGFKNWLIGYMRYGNINHSYFTISVKMQIHDIYDLYLVMVEYEISDTAKLMLIVHIIGDITCEDIKMFTEMYGKKCIAWDIDSCMKISEHMHWKDWININKVNSINHSIFYDQSVMKRFAWQCSRYDLAGIKKYIKTVAESESGISDVNVLVDLFEKTLDGKSLCMTDLLILSLLDHNLSGFDRINDNEILIENLLNIVLLNQHYLRADFVYAFEFKFWNLLITTAKCKLSLGYLYSYIVGNKCPRIISKHKRHRYPNTNAIHAGMLYVLYGRDGKTLNAKNIFNWAEYGETYLVYKLIEQLRNVNHIKLEDILYRFCILHFRGMFSETGREYIERVFKRISKNYYMLDKIKLALLLVCMPVSGQGSYTDIYLKLAIKYFSIIIS